MSSRTRWSRAWVVSLGLVLVVCLGSAPVRAEPQRTPPPEEPAATSADEGPERPVKQIKMYVENWKWTPDVIRVERGARLVIDFQNYDAPHRFDLKAFGIKVPLAEGKTAHVEFDVDKAGKFTWRCGRPCGNGCAKMRGKLIVE